MGRSVARCMKVAELVSELGKHDGDLVVRFRDGDAVYPGIYVMREDRTDHVDVGSPYPVRDRLAEVAELVSETGKHDANGGKYAGDVREKCRTAGELRRALERIPDDCLVNTVDDSTIVGECVHVVHEKNSGYVDVGIVGNDRTRGE